jgi:hypothetical protein
MIGKFYREYGLPGQNKNANKKAGGRKKGLLTDSGGMYVKKISFDY